MVEVVRELPLLLTATVQLYCAIPHRTRQCAEACAPTPQLSPPTLELHRPSLKGAPVDRLHLSLVRHPEAHNQGAVVESVLYQLG